MNPLIIIPLAMIIIGLFLFKSPGVNFGLTMPKGVNGLAAGFVGWFLVFTVYWGIIWLLGKYVYTHESSLILIAFTIPIPIVHLIALSILLAIFKTRKIGVGVLLAVIINIAGLIIFQPELIGNFSFSSVAFFLGIGFFSMPFFIPGSIL